MFRRENIKNMSFVMIQEMTSIPLLVLNASWYQLTTISVDDVKLEPILCCYYKRSSKLIVLKYFQVDIKRTY